MKGLGVLAEIDGAATWGERDGTASASGVAPGIREVLGAGRGAGTEQVFSTQNSTMSTLSTAPSSDTVSELLQAIAGQTFGEAQETNPSVSGKATAAAAGVRWRSPLTTRTRWPGNRSLPRSGMLHRISFPQFEHGPNGCGAFSIAPAAPPVNPRPL
jgi:hypothetical protein